MSSRRDSIWLNEKVGDICKRVYLDNSVKEMNIQTLLGTLYHKTISNETTYIHRQAMHGC